MSKEFENLDGEIWKEIDGYDGYDISNLGRIRSWWNNHHVLIDTPHIMAMHKDKDGYFRVHLHKDCKSKSPYVHRLVAMAFIPNTGNKPQVNHINGVKDDNRVENLEWCTLSENRQHAYNTGLQKPAGEKAVKIIETGEVFKSLSECARSINGNESGIRACLRGSRNTHKELHFERVDKSSIKKSTNFLYDYQLDAVNRLHNGSILCGGVGSGKSRSGLFYYFSQNGGWIDKEGYTPMETPQDLIIITTAKKRDSLEWIGELANFLLVPDDDDKTRFGNTIVVDSWNNLPKYKNIKNAFFILDEQRLVSYGAWTKAFLKIAQNNDWILLSATPGDTYSDYLPIFLANGFFRNKTEFNQEHVMYSRYTKYPKIDKYLNTGRLDRLINRILVVMDYNHDIIKHDEVVYCEYDIRKYKDVIRRRWDIYNDCPLQDAGGLCRTLRRVVNSDETRQAKLLEILEDHPRAIIFYNYNFERDILLSLDYGEGVEVSEWSGHAHKPVPKSEKWIYICQYASASEGWECTDTNCVIFYSQSYSWKMMTQAKGRVDRLNTSYGELYYYTLKSRAGIDLAISKALSQKKKFNERKFAKW